MNRRSVTLLLLSAVAFVLAFAWQDRAATPEMPPVPSPGQENPFKHTNERIYIMAEGYQILDRPKDRRLLAFSGPDGKIGFATNTSCPSVRYLPVFEDAYINWTLIPLKYKGKWGAIDVSFDRVPGADPIIPFEYDRIDVLDDWRAELWKDGRKTSVDIRDIRPLLSE